MSSEDGFSAVEGVVPGGVDTTFESVLDNNVVVYPHTPTGVPGWKMVFETESINPLELRGILSESILESGIMIAEGPKERRTIRTFLYLPQSFTTSLKFINYAGCAIPSYTGKPADTGPVE